MAINEEDGEVCLDWRQEFQVGSINIIKSSYVCFLSIQVQEYIWNLNCLDHDCLLRMIVDFIAFSKYTVHSENRKII